MTHFIKKIPFHLFFPTSNTKGVFFTIKDLYGSKPCSLEMNLVIESNWALHLSCWVIDIFLLGSSVSSGVDELITRVVTTVCLCRMSFCSIQQFGDALFYNLLIWVHN
jgi:hypothetical protein